MEDRRYSRTTNLLLCFGKKEIDMDLATATNIAEIIASLGVVITLIYIAKEFRHSAERTRIESIGRGIETQVRQFARLAEHPEKAELLRHALADFNSLTQAQKGQVSTVIHDIALSHNAIRHAYESGQLPEGEFRALQSNWLSLMRTQGGRQWWQGWRHMMPDDVVEYVDSTLDDPNIEVKPLDEEVPWLFALDDSSPNQQ
jgi:hypothetical protein